MKNEINKYYLPLDFVHIFKIRIKLLDNEDRESSFQHEFALLLPSQSSHDIFPDLTLGFEKVAQIWYKTQTAAACKIETNKNSSIEQQKACAIFFVKTVLHRFKLFRMQIWLLLKLGLDNEIRTELEHISIFNSRFLKGWIKFLKTTPNNLVKQNQ